MSVIKGLSLLLFLKEQDAYWVQADSFLSACQRELDDCTWISFDSPSTVTNISTDSEESDPGSAHIIYGCLIQALYALVKL